jgi:parvulin-like peptidyl-prolyl isomerase
MKRLFPLIILLLGVAPARSESAAVVGRVGDIEITTTELRESLAGLLAEQKTAVASDPAAVAQYLRSLLVQKLILKQASEQKWDQDPAVIARLVRARETAIAETFLEAKSKPDESYPTESELKEAYEANKDKLIIPRSYQLAQIYISEAENADAATKAAAKSRLDAIVKQLAAKDADFAAIARKSSEEPASAAEGGKIGWLADSQIQPAIREKLPTLTLGKISDPIRLTDGWHILKVLDIREPRTPTLDELRDTFVTRLRAERSLSTRQDFIANLLKDNPLAINEIELMKLPDAP